MSFIKIIGSESQLDLARTLWKPRVARKIVKQQTKSKRQPQVIFTSTMHE